MIMYQRNGKAESHADRVAREGPCEGKDVQR